MRILLADDHPQPRRALRVLLQHEAGLSVAGEAEDSESLNTQVAVLQPDLVLVDWGLLKPVPKGSIDSLRRFCPSLRVVVLSGRPEVRPAALDAGADAFASKGDPPDVLLAAIRSLNPTRRPDPSPPSPGPPVTHSGGATAPEEGVKGPILRFAW